MMQTLRRHHWSLAVAVAFACGVFVGSMAPHQLVKAQHNVSQQGGGSARDAFLAGGDRSYAVLRDIRTEMRESSRILREISSTEKRIERSLERNLSTRTQND